MANNLNPVWLRDELILALNLYFEIDYPNSLAENDPRIGELSELLMSLPVYPANKRTASFRNSNGVKMKLANFLSLDESYQGKGLERASKADRVIWNEFAFNREQLKSVAKAIQRHANEFDYLPAEWPESEIEAPEGRLLLGLHIRRERNRRIVAAKKLQAWRNHGRLACEACNFDFERVYGLAGKDLIECHHVVPLVDLQPGSKTKLSELALLCSNCHRIAHRGKKVRSVHEIRALLLHD